MLVAPSLAIAAKAVQEQITEQRQEMR